MTQKPTLPPEIVGHLDELELSIDKFSTEFPHLSLIKTSNFQDPWNFC